MKNFKSITILTALFCAFFASSTEAQLRDRDKAELSEINVLVNPGFELGLVRWASTGTAPTLTTTASEVALGKASASWDAAADGDTFSTQQYTMPNILEGNICEASLRYNGGDDNIDLKVVDGTSTVLGTVTLVAASSWTKASVTFTCPDSGTVGFTLEATADAAEIFVDQAVLGRSSDLINQVGSTGWINWETEAEAIGLAPFGGTVSSVDFNYYQYKVESNQVTVYFSVDATTASTVQTVSIPLPIDNDIQSPVTVGPRSLQIYVSDGAGTELADTKSQFRTDDRDVLQVGRTGTANFADGASFRVEGIFTYPIDPANAPSSINPVVKVETSAWWAQAYMDDNSSINTSDDGGVWDFDSGNSESLTSSKHKNAPIYRACSDVDPSLVDCAGGNGIVGVAVDVPKSGAINVCMQFGHTYTGDDIDQFFRISRFENASTTLAEAGQNQVQRRIDNNNAVDRNGSFVHLCEIFEVNSGLNSFVLQEITDINVGSIVGNSIRDISFIVHPIDQQLPQAVLLKEANTSSRDDGSTINLTDATTADIASLSLSPGKYLILANVSSRCLHSSDYTACRMAVTVTDSSNTSISPDTCHTGMAKTFNGPTYTYEGHCSLQFTHNLTASETIKMRQTMTTIPVQGTLQSWRPYFEAIRLGDAE